MTQTLLDLTQNILSRLESDEVNSITDSVEARQVANIIKNTYFNILTRADLPKHAQTFSLDASTDLTMPVIMSKPANVTRIDWIKYDAETNGDLDYQYVTILPLEQFLDMTQGRNPDESNIETFTLDGKTLYYMNDRQPTYCTIYKNFYVIFDGYNSVLDSTLQSAKTYCFGRVIPTFEMTDLFVPDLDDAQFPLLLNEATSVAFLEMKQIVNEASAQESRRQWQNLNRTKDLVKPNYFDRLPNFSRVR